jgi:FkbM family methyltransferase
MPSLFRTIRPHLRDYLLSGLEARVNQLEARLNQIGARLDALDAIAVRLDEILSAQRNLTARDGPLVATVAAEVDRLDSYLLHHSTTLGERVAAAHADLVHHSKILGKRVAAYAMKELDALVLGGDFDLIVPTQETGLLSYILRHGLEVIEPGVRAVLRDRLKPGAVAVDAGANIGIHALTMAAAVGPQGHVRCFEPMPHLAVTLERTLRLNGFGDRTRVEQVALADERGEATLYRAEHGPMSSLYALPDGLGAEPITVRVVTLDECFPPGARVDLVKMDVEGAEPRVWRGLQRILDENADIEIVLEWSASHFRRSGEDPQAFITKIRAAGFTPFVIQDDPQPSGQLVPLSDDVGALEARNLLLTRRAAGEAT